MAKDGGMSIVMSAIAMSFKRFLLLIVELDDVKNKCLVTRNNPCSLKSFRTIQNWQKKLKMG